MAKVMVIMVMMVMMVMMVTRVMMVGSPHESLRSSRDAAAKATSALLWFTYELHCTLYS